VKEATVTTTDTPAAEAFAAWVVLDLFGRQKAAGRASEQKIAGKDFLRLDVPAVDGRQARTLLYSPDAVYAIEPVDEETARVVAAHHRPPEPVSAWSAREMVRQSGSQLALAAHDPDDDEDGPDDEDLV
jgi:hypothetical protein